MPAHPVQPSSPDPAASPPLLAEGWFKPRAKASLGRHLPPGLAGFVWKASAVSQPWLIALSMVVALLDTAPIEIQRRIVNQTIKLGDTSLIMLLALAYASVAAVQGLTKAGTNIYRSWVSETAVLELRQFISKAEHDGARATDGAETRGAEISMLIAEADAVGGFTGDAFAEPVLQAGILVSVLAYLAYIQPLMSLLTLFVILPQATFVPLLQMAINRRVQKRIKLLRATSQSVFGQGDPQDVLKLQARYFRMVFALNMGVSGLKFSMNFLMNLMHQLGIAAVLGVGGWLVMQGRTETGTVVAFISGLQTVRGPWGDLVNWFQSYSLTRAKYALIYATMDASVTPAGVDPDPATAAG